MIWSISLWMMVSDKDQNTNFILRYVHIHDDILPVVAEKDPAWHRAHASAVVAPANQTRTD